MKSERAKSRPGRRKAIWATSILVPVVAVSFFLQRIAGPQGKEPSHAQGTGQEPALLPPPDIAQINRVLSGSLALVEAQHTFYTHVKLSERFAVGVAELGFHKNQGCVMVYDVWHASDAVPEPVPLAGYLYQSKLLTRSGTERDGFVIAAFPAGDRGQKHGWPLFLSMVPNADGSIIGMSARETWEIKEPGAIREIRAVFEQDKLVWEDLERWSPERFPASSVIKDFEKQE